MRAIAFEDTKKEMEKKIAANLKRCLDLEVHVTPLTTGGHHDGYSVGNNRERPVFCLQGNRPDSTVF